MQNLKPINMRISKTMAEAIAKKVLEKNYKAVDDLKKSFDDKAIAAYKANVPKAVWNTFKAHRMYINTTRYLKLGSYFGYYQVMFRENMPDSRNSGLFEFEGDLKKEMELLHNKIEVAAVKLRDLHSETVSALLAMGTTKKIREMFPEAAKLLPDDEQKVTTMALVVNLDSIRKRIAK